MLWDGALTPLIYADPASGGDGAYHLAAEDAGNPLTITLETGGARGPYWTIRNRQGMVWRFGFTADSA